MGGEANGQHSQVPSGHPPPKGQNISLVALAAVSCLITVTCSLLAFSAGKAAGRAAVTDHHKAMAVATMFQEMEKHLTELRTQQLSSHPSLVSPNPQISSMPAHQQHDDGGPGWFSYLLALIIIGGTSVGVFMLMNKGDAQAETDSQQVPAAQKVSTPRQEKTVLASPPASSGSLATDFRNAQVEQPRQERKPSDARSPPSSSHAPLPSTVVRPVEQQPQLQPQKQQQQQQQQQQQAQMVQAQASVMRPQPVLMQPQIAMPGQQMPQMMAYQQAGGQPLHHNYVVYQG